MMKIRLIPTIEPSEELSFRPINFYVAFHKEKSVWLNPARSRQVYEYD
jgi:hypothetical protein